MRARPADQHRDPWRGQLGDTGEGLAGPGQPGVVDRMQAAGQGDHVVAAEPVVLLAVQVNDAPTVAASAVSGSLSVVLVG